MIVHENYGEDEDDAEELEKEGEETWHADVWFEGVPFNEDWGHVGTNYSKDAGVDDKKPESKVQMLVDKP